jgi:hypothetical protein
LSEILSEKMKEERKRHVETAESLVKLEKKINIKIGERKE